MKNNSIIILGSLSDGAIRVGSGSVSPPLMDCLGIARATPGKNSPSDCIGSGII